MITNLQERAQELGLTLENLLNDLAQEKNNGSGIGLSIVNEIVKAHRGEFIIGNEGGAFFKIVLKKVFTMNLPVSVLLSSKR